VLAGVWRVDTLVALAPPNLPRLQDVSINLPVLLFALAVSVLVAAGLGTSTALRAAPGNLQGALVERGQGHAGTPGSQRLGRLIVADNWPSRWCCWWAPACWAGACCASFRLIRVSAPSIS